MVITNAAKQGHDIVEMGDWLAFVARVFTAIDERDLFLRGVFRDETRQIFDTPSKHKTCLEVARKALGGLSELEFLAVFGVDVAKSTQCCKILSSLVNGTKKQKFPAAVVRRAVLSVLLLRTQDESLPSAVAIADVKKAETRT